jgi:hypothetical protein
MEAVIMISLHGYEIIEQIFNGINSTIYRGKRNSDNMNVIIKVLNREYPTSEELAYFTREYDILFRLTGENIIKVFSQKILDAVSKTPLVISCNKIMYKTCSIGCTCLPFESDLPVLINLEQAVNICDIAMYKAKQRGRNRAVHIVSKKSGNYTGEDLKKYILGLTEESDIDERFLGIEEVENKV